MTCFMSDGSWSNVQRMGSKSFGLTLGPKAHEVAIHMHGMHVVGHPSLMRGTPMFCSPQGLINRTLATYFYDLAITNTTRKLI